MTGGWALLPRKEDRITGRFFRACLAELFGTFGVILWGGACVTNALSQATITSPSLYIAIGFAFAHATAIYLFYDISGGHFNPAVSLGMFIAQKISFIRCLCYILCQFSGGFMGAGILYALNSVSAGHINIASGMKVNVAFCWELIGSTLLVFIYLAGTNENRGRTTRMNSCDLPFTIGITILMLHLAIFPFTGCALSPVRGLIFNVVNGKVFTYQWIYVVAPFLGCIIAAIGYQVVFSVQYKASWTRCSHSSGLNSAVSMSNNLVLENVASKI